VTGVMRGMAPTADSRVTNVMGRTLFQVAVISDAQPRRSGLSNDPPALVSIRDRVNDTRFAEGEPVEYRNEAPEVYGVFGGGSHSIADGWVR
jgi:hypothetical protein